ncbi:MAG: DNA-directed RNA polymerase [Nanoarchaeota archaeon]
MFYVIEVEDYVRVDPKLFGLDTIDAVEQQLKETYKEYMDKEIGKAIAVVSVIEVKDGIIIPGDGAAYYNSRFKLLVWKPELQELCYGIVTEVVNFGAFMDLGVIRGMIHISQTMEDYVSFSKSNALIGKVTKRTLKKADTCIARIVAVSYKSDEPKIGLTMRQPGLGRLEWIKEEKKRKERPARGERGEEKVKEKKGKKK